MSRRLTIFLAVSFLVTWTCWGVLVPLARARTMVYGQLPFMFLYMLGGLGPTIAAYIAVLATRAQSPLGEFHSRLFRWRVAGWWYVIAAALPAALALASVGVAILVDPDFPRGLSVRPWYMLVPLFFVMVGGGGLEELGWRGIAQPEMERCLRRPTAAVLVGLIWSLWHLPLFVLPGVGQYGTNFPVFAIGLVGGALILAWLYGRTESILLCILFHAGWNAIAALGLAIPSDQRLLAVLDACLRVVVGALLLAVGSAPSNTYEASRCQGVKFGRQISL
jgi:membrane protease YdiL (CAAX protease family)